MKTVRDLMEQAEFFSDLVADAILKKTAPVRDDLSQREAEAAYGTRWLRKMRQEGLATWRLVGRRVVYSRHQLDCLRAAERQHSELILKGRIV